MARERLVRPLTDKQAAVLAFIREAVTRDGFPPTTREIQDAFGFRAFETARVYLRTLETKGYLRLHYATARGITLLPCPPAFGSPDH